MTRVFRRSQMTAMSCERRGLRPVPHATSVTTVPAQQQGRGVSAYALVLGVALSCLLSLSACSFVEQKSSNGKAGPPTAAGAPAQTGPTPMDTFRALAPPEGMKFTPLFAVPIKDDAQRFARIEQSVQALRNDFDTVTPTLVRLAAIEKDIRELVTQLRTLNDGAPIAEAPVAPVAVAPAPAPALAAPVTAKQVAVQPQQAPVPLVPPAPVTVTSSIKQPAPVAPVVSPVPDKGINAGGTDTAPAVQAVAGKPAPSLPVTPEATPTGPKPPEGVASPSSAPVAPAKAKPVPVVPPAPSAPPPMDLTPVLPQHAQPAAQPTPAPAPAVAPAVTMGPIMGDVRTIRIGDHIDKTRIVLDVTAKADYRARLENDGRRLVIELPQYAWKAETSWKDVSAPLVSGYRYADGALVVDLQAPVTIRQQASLPAADGAGPRIIIDVFSPLVHVE